MPNPQDSEFVPRGAVASFAVVVVFFAAIWLSLYALALSRR
jgi:hypothetical protein